MGFINTIVINLTELYLQNWIFTFYYNFNLQGIISPKGLVTSLVAKVYRQIQQILKGMAIAPVSIVCFLH